jgi:hypothetical protein
MFVVSVQGGEPRLVYASDPWSDYAADDAYKPFRFPLNALADWTSDSRYLGINANDEGRPALFRLRVKDGAASRSLVLVRAGDLDNAWSTCRERLYSRATTRFPGT